MDAKEQLQSSVMEKIGRESGDLFFIMHEFGSKRQLHCKSLLGKKKVKRQNDVAGDV